MNKKALLIGLGLLAVAGVALAARQQIASDPAAADPGNSGDAAAIPWDEGAADWISYWTNHNEQETQVNTMPIPMPSAPSSNLAALRSAIKWAEGTANQPDPYRVCVGYKHTIVSFDDHPAITKEWRGEPLSDEQCRGAGFGPGCVSTAAGAYQILKPTWSNLKSRLKLADFSPGNQDAACDELLRECGAAKLVEQGRFQEAIYAARKIWASLPGANYAGQGMRTIESLTARYTAAGGVLA